MIELVTGRVYRRRDLHSQIGGQWQGGISTPAKSKVILLFTGPAGEHYGYRDYWTANGRFHYYGEGQAGNMEMIRGNRAIRDHIQNNKRLLRFQSVAKGQVCYLGEMRYVTRETVEAPDIDGRYRCAIVFELEPIDSQATQRARSMLQEPDNQS